MPRPKTLKPKYCHHKASGRAFVLLNGEFVYLGPYESQESRDAYDKAIGEWIAKGRQSAVTAPETPVPSLTVSSLIHAFWEHAKTYYVHRDGSPTSEQENLRQALRPLRRLYGPTAAAEFGPLKLKALREDMLKPTACTDEKTGETVTRPGWARTHVNRQIARLKSVFKWAVSMELVPASVHQGLATVSALKRGRTQAREAEPVKPVPDELVDGVLSHVSPQVRAMIELQLLTGMRPGEACAMRSCDVDTSGKLWVYRPADHKTAHHGHDRVIYFGTQAQAILRPHLKPDLQAHVFSPAEAEASRLAAVHAARKTPLHYGNRPGTNRKRSPQRQPGDRYDVTAYRRAIARGCDKAFPPPEPLAKRKGETAAAWRARLTGEQKAALRRWRGDHRWHPHQLRHNAGTRFRREYGLEAAQVLLGHRTVTATQIYAEQDVREAMRIMGEVG